ncbi:hypothetical protein ACRALDRAFT_1076806 [Sodiomyces alcalophilus JCM 7366]|uniref:uncharacterized protein n=1 Tax=Sodiomyces alcalophilus JCM 7366 TaxID=591952 RepID=UPI0039B39CFA
MMAEAGYTTTTSVTYSYLDDYQPHPTLAPRYGGKEKRDDQDERDTDTTGRTSLSSIALSFIFDDDMSDRKRETTTDSTTQSNGAIRGVPLPPCSSRPPSAPPIFGLSIHGANLSPPCSHQYLPLPTRHPSQGVRRQPLDRTYRQARPLRPLRPSTPPPTTLNRPWSETSRSSLPARTTRKSLPGPSSAFRPALVASPLP